MAGKIRAKAFTDAASLKKSLKKGGGGSTWLKRVPGEGSLLVRFITEPYEWVTYKEHYDPDADPRSFPCTEEDCAGCESDVSRVRSTSNRYLSNAVDIENDVVIPLVLPKSLAKNLFAAYEKYGTITDRDYDLSRSGEGLDTTYSAFPESPSQMKLSKYEPLDLWDTLEGQLDDLEDDDEEDEAPQRPVKKALPKKKVLRKRA